MITVTINTPATAGVDTVRTTATKWWNAVCAWTTKNVVTPVKAAAVKVCETTKAATKATVTFVIGAACLVAYTTAYIGCVIVAFAAISVLLAHPLFVLFVGIVICASLCSDETAVGMAACAIGVALVLGWACAAVVAIAFEVIMLVIVLAIAAVVAIACSGIKSSYRM